MNPLGGCIPALLQIPIFFALYSFFNSNIELKRCIVLWAEDLSSYDMCCEISNVCMGIGKSPAFVYHSCCRYQLFNFCI